MKITRRGFIQTAGAATAAGMVGVPYIALGASKKVVIVGGGTGGLNLGALLAQAGKKVLVLERHGEELLGGRAASGKLGDAAVDNGIKGLILAGFQDEVYRRLGKQMPENVCEWTNSGQVYMNDRWRKLDDMIQEEIQHFGREIHPFLRERDANWTCFHFMGFLVLVKEHVFIEIGILHVLVQ